MSTWHRVIASPAGRIGRFITLFLWVAVMAIAGSTTGNTADLNNSELGERLPADTQTTIAKNLTNQRFTNDGTTPLLVVYHRDGGLTETDLDTATADLDALSSLTTIDTPPPVPSKDGEALLLTLLLPETAVNDVNLDDTISKARDITANDDDTLTIAITGGAAIQYDMTDAFAGLDQTLLIITIGIVAILLLITYRSPLLLLLPLLSVGFATQLTKAAIYLLAKYADMIADPQSTGILTVLVFGVGTDYALLLIARYREELRRNTNRFTAMRIALPRTIPAILASAGTVVLAMLTLTAADLAPTAALGPVAAVGIIAALLTMTTLLPALLVTCGRGVFWPSIPHYDSEHSKPTNTHRLWNRVAQLVQRHTRPIWLGSVVLLLGLATGTTTLTGGLSLADGFTSKPDSVTGQEILTQHYDPGLSGPVTVIANTSDVTATITVLENTNGIARIAGNKTSTDGELTAITAILDHDPASDAAETTVTHLRATLDDAIISGTTASNIDLHDTMNNDLKTVMPLILAVVFAVLILLLRSLIAPIILLASVIVSYIAALGASGLILSITGHTIIDDNVLLYSFLFLVALGVDYTIFLMSRAKEETKTLGHAKGITHSLTVTGGVITSAGIVLAATFLALTVMPLVFMMQIGIVVAVGVLIDTLIVRSLLVPALALDIGPKTWWPAKTQ